MVLQFTKDQVDELRKKGQELIDKGYLTKDVIKELKITHHMFYEILKLRIKPFEKRGPKIRQFKLNETVNDNKTVSQTNTFTPVTPIFSFENPRPKKTILIITEDIDLIKKMVKGYE